MNTGQMLITVAALALLSVVILRVNNGYLSTNSIMYESKFGVLAVSLATSMLEEASGKAFDEATVQNPTNDLSDLTSYGSFGKDSYEAYPAFDDFDDYDGYSRIDSTLPSARFNIDCSVYYINPTDPNGSTSSKTWHKKLTVKVSSPSMEDTVQMSTVFSYFFYR